MDLPVGFIRIVYAHILRVFLLLVYIVLLRKNKTKQAIGVIFGLFNNIGNFIFIEYLDECCRGAIVVLLFPFDDAALVVDILLFICFCIKFLLNNS